MGEKFAGVNIEELRKLETAQKKMRSKRKQKKSLRCGECDKCRMENCGECKNCKDMKQFGGEQRIKQACEKRKCEAMLREDIRSLAVFPAMKVQSWRTFISCTI